MPYAGQSAGKTGHDDLLRNPEIDRFLSACDHMREPSQEELGSIAAGFAPAPTGEGHPLPAVVVASDGSRYEASLSRLYPSTRVGYVKVSSLGVEVDAYVRLAGDASRLLDPFAVNRLQENATALSLALPSTNLRYGDGETVADGFRCRLDEVFRGEATRTGRRRERLIDTLYALAIRSEKNGRVLEDGRPAVAVRACPRCRLEPKGGFVVPADAASVTCPGEAGRPCGAVIYATDALRLHEAFTDLGSNEETLTRVMNAVEHILLAHYIRVAADDNLAGLSEVCFMLDGPLALFGMPAWLSRPMLRLIDEVRERQRAVGLRPFLLIGLQKQGQLAEHLGLIGRTPSWRYPTTTAAATSSRPTRAPISGTKPTTARISSSTPSGATPSPSSCPTHGPKSGSAAAPRQGPSAPSRPPRPTLPTTPTSAARSTWCGCSRAICSAARSCRSFSPIGTPRSRSSRAGKCSTSRAFSASGARVAAGRARGSHPDRNGERKLGAPGRTRTSTTFRPTDFESAASTDFATGARRR
jgi:hypothetical protein